MIIIEQVNNWYIKTQVLDDEPCIFKNILPVKMILSIAIWGRDNRCLAQGQILAILNVRKDSANINQLPPLLNEFSSLQSIV